MHTNWDILQVISLISTHLCPLCGSVDVTYLPLRRGLWVRKNSQKIMLACILQNATRCSRTSWSFCHTAFDMVCIGTYQGLKPNLCSKTGLCGITFVKIVSSNLHPAPCELVYLRKNISVKQNGNCCVTPPLALLDPPRLLYAWPGTGLAIGPSQRVCVFVCRCQARAVVQLRRRVLAADGGLLERGPLPEAPAGHRGAQPPAHHVVPLQLRSEK